MWGWPFMLMFHSMFPGKPSILRSALVCSVSTWIQLPRRNQPHTWSWTSSRSLLSSIRQPVGAPWCALLESRLREYGQLHVCVLDASRQVDPGWDWMGQDRSWEGSLSKVHVTECEHERSTLHMCGRHASRMPGSALHSLRGATDLSSGLSVNLFGGFPWMN